MFKALFVHLGFIIIGCGLTGCLFPNPHASLKYSIATEKIKDGPPVPAAHQSPTTRGLTLDPIRIQPETAPGYDTLPSSVTQIYDRKPVGLSLADVVVLNFSNNRQIKIQGLNVRIAEYGVPAAEGIYDLLLASNFRYTRTERESGRPPVFTVSRSRGKTGQIALSQLLPTGGTVAVTLDANQSAMNNYGNDATLEVRQPLLRGMGWGVTNADIRIALLESQATHADFRSELANQLADALTTYWDLIGAIQALKVDIIAYAAARDLLRVNQARFDVGMLAPSDLLQTQAALDARYERIVTDRQRIRNVEDRLKRLIFIDSSGPAWDAQLAPTQAIAWREMLVDFDAAVALAERERPELAASRLAVEQARERLRVARNDVLPGLDLVGSLLPNGVGSGFDEGFRNLREAKAMGYILGLEFSYPLQNRAARYRNRQAIARVEQAEERYKDTRDRVTLEVRQAARAYTSARERITVTLSQIASERANLETEVLRLQVGLSTTFRVLQFLEDLANAQLKHIQAVLETNRAAIALERAQGTILETYGVHTVEAPEKQTTKPDSNDKSVKGSSPK